MIPQADLYKESKTFRGRTWSTRHFVLSGQWLFYYKSQSSYSKGDPPHKALDVADCWIMEKGIVKSGSKVRMFVCFHTKTLVSPQRIPCRVGTNVEQRCLQTWLCVILGAPALLAYFARPERA